MSLYTRKDGQFVQLTREQVRRLRRTTQVVHLQDDALNASRTLRSFAAWLQTLNRKALKVGHPDLIIARAPNVERILKVCDRIDKDVQELKNV